MVVPALVYVAFNVGDEAVSAWGVVISTDTAFLLGVLALLGPACPPQLRVFLLALAALGVALMFRLRWLKVWRGPAYLVLAIAAWVALYASGVHPTLLGVLSAMTTPAYPPRREEVEYAAQRTRAYLHFSNCFSKQLSWKLVKAADT